MTSGSRADAPRRNVQERRAGFLSVSCFLEDRGDVEKETRPKPVVEDVDLVQRVAAVSNGLSGSPRAPAILCQVEERVHADVGAGLGEEQRLPCGGLGRVEVTDQHFDLGEQSE